MPTTEEKKPASGAVEAPTAQERQRPGWLIPVLVVAAIAVIAGAVIAAVALTGDDATDPEAVVVESIEAYNARDIDTLETLFDPAVVVTYDGSGVGIPLGEIPDDVGRDAVLARVRETPASWTVAYEVLTVSDTAVTTSEVATFPDGSSTRHTVIYQVSDEGLITRVTHIIEE